jgi:hypothetical protein
MRRLPDEQFLQSKTQATASLRQSPPIALRSIKFVADWTGRASVFGR